MGNLSTDEQSVPAARRRLLDDPPYLGACEPMRADAALLGQEELEQASRSLRIDCEPLSQEDRGRCGELVERNAAAMLVLGGAAVRDVGAAERSIHRGKYQD